VKDGIGWDQPLAADHFGQLTVNDSIRYGRALEQFDMAWMEDPLQVGTLGSGDAPRNWRAYREITEATTTPINTGESLFGLEEGFRPLIENRAVDLIHPDPLTSGAIRETKRIADYASMFGIPTAVHFAGSPVGCMASVHMIATIKDFVAMENHAVDIPWWGDLVNGVPKPIVNNGYIQVPNTPGLGVELNEEACKQHLRIPGYFEPTPQYDKYIVDEFRTGGPYPHLDAEGKPVNAR
jgi:L-alanine-DL-glutamate epimerase-like enolase superfamily enzyme